MAKDPAILAHQEWLGYVQPVGLVVSIPAMLDANVRVNQNFAPEHRNFLEALPTGKDGEPVPEVSDFPEFAESVLGWSRSDLYGAPGSPELPTPLEVSLPDYNETLRPTYALREYEPAENASEWILLIKVLTKGTDFDAVEEIDSRNWQASPQAKFERLLRQVRIPIGLLVNGQQIRLVYTPDKELSGYVTFKLADMVTVAGRPIFGAFHMLLSTERLYSVAERERLPAILENSRKYQNVVSTRLANQVLEALYELLRGFQAADDQAQGQLLHDLLAADPDLVYRGLLTTLLRMVFVLYAEDRGLLSTNSVFANYYSITGLYERLRIDDGRFPDTMDQRYGAWAQLLTLFRLVYRGGSHGAMRIPARDGYLFDPDRYLFLEGRRSQNDEVSIPQVPDGVLFRVLSKLMLLDGERISYRTLAVEQIGSVYEAIMGFELHVASGPSIAMNPAKKHGAPTTINLEALLQAAPDKRLKWFTDETDQKLTGKAVDLLKTAASVNDLMNALERKIASSVTPGIVAKGAMIFQPSDERRRSGSHYTPSSLTGPIVEAALAPVLKQLGHNPTPAQILNLKVCDPAMGSGAFLVEACRQLGSALSRAWHAHSEAPVLPPDEDEELHAQRQIAQRCLYGVDKNPMATDLAKLSLWLATLAKDHPFTFLDHSLRSGDSLVGLSVKQAACFNWSDSQSVLLDLERELRARIERVNRYRRQILESGDDVPYATRKQKLAAADDSLGFPRLAADAVIAAFFSAEKPRARAHALAAVRECAEVMLRDPTNLEAADEVERAVAKLHHGSKGVVPFHWGLEFPEVFSLDKAGEQIGGFDAMIGNPPFMGGHLVWSALGGSYRDYIKLQDPESGGKAVDLVAHFFRRCFNLTRHEGAIGLIATNTIAQGDTRSAGLKYLCQNGGTIYSAVRRLWWPGNAAVVVSVIHVRKGPQGPAALDGRAVPALNSFLFASQDEFDPLPLQSNARLSYRGSMVYGMGFTFDDTNPTATSLEVMKSIAAKDPRNEERIYKFIGGEDLNSHPSQDSNRYIINFEDMPLWRAAEWPDLLEIVRQKVKPERDALGGYGVADRRREYWWQYGSHAAALQAALRALPRCLALSQVSQHLSLCFQPTGRLFSHTAIVFPIPSFSAFSVLQSRLHEIWARFFGSSMKDDLRYTPSDCFESFPLPPVGEAAAGLEAAGNAYYEYRSALMLANNEGLTKTYNRFHDRNECSWEIQRLRELHAAMDRTVLDAYGWSDLQPTNDFFQEFDDEEDEDGAERPTRRKYRYRWPDEIRDEILARLLELNRLRALEEGQLLAAKKASSALGSELKKKGTRKSSPKTAEPSLTASLFAAEEEDA
jgi:hypothetical protein